MVSFAYLPLNSHEKHSFESSEDNKARRSTMNVLCEVRECLSSFSLHVLDGMIMYPSPILSRQISIIEIVVFIVMNLQLAWQF